MKLLTSRRVLVGIGSLALILLIWLLLRWWLRMDVVLCFALTTAILLLYVIYLLVDQKGAAKDSAGIEKSIWQQGEDQKRAAHPAKRREVEELREKLETVIGKLKRARGRAALSTIPWYMMIGPPAAGKTTAIRNSGLEFPFETDVKLQGVGGTRNCDWWFSSAAIILDTAGRYVEQDDREDWLGFLRAVKKHRRRRPINGVIVAVSIADLLTADADALDAFARTLRKRIDELIVELGVRFPAYLLFTKCDLVSGFVEFFGEFGRDQREQIWGCTFGRKDLEDRDARAVFSREFLALSNALMDLRLRRLSQGLSRQQRARIYTFPMEFARGRENLAYFAGKLFQPNPYQEGPLFRGFYFTSGTQEGVPIDNVVREIARAFGLAAPGETRFDPELQTKSYFLKDLFTEVMIPDSGLVQPTRRQKTLLTRMKTGVVSAAVLGLVLFVFLISQAYVRSKEIIDGAGEQVKLALASAPPSDRDILLRQIVQLEDTPSLTFGLDRSTELADSALRLYFRRLRPDLQESVIRRLEGLLLNPQTPQSDIIDHLQAYLWLTTQTGLLNDPAKQQTLKLFFAQFADPDKRIDGRHLVFVTSHLADAVDRGLAKPFPINQQVVASARRRAGALNVGVYYEDLLGRLEQTVPGQRNWTDSYLIANREIRAAFTRDGMRTMEEMIKGKEYRKVREDLQGILGAQEGPGEAKVEENSTIEDSLRALYARDYVSEWWSFLEGITVQQPQNLPDAIAELQTLGHPSRSPLLRLLESVAEHTDTSRMNQGLLDETADAIAAAAKTERKTTAVLVSRQFRELHNLLGKEGESALQGVMKRYQELSVELESLNRADFNAVVQHVWNVMKGQNSLGALPGAIRLVSDTRDPRAGVVLKKLLSSPVHYAWRISLTKATDVINNRWREEVVGVYRGMSRDYPFDRASPAEQPAASVQKILGDEGALWTMMGELKDLFAEKEKWGGQKWDFDPIALEIAPTARAALWQARVASNALFSNKALNMKILFRVESAAAKDGTDIDKIFIDVGTVSWNCELDDKKSPRIVQVHWPATDASIRLVDEPPIFGIGDDKVVCSFTRPGEWGLFRLIQESKYELGPTPTTMKCSWVSSDKNFTVRCTVTVEGASLNPFTTDYRIPFPDDLVRLP